MERFSAVRAAENRTPQMASMQNWVERFICGTNPHQMAVGKREDEFGLKVTQLMFDNKNRWAHVCPFVRDSLDYDHFWIEESNLNDDSAALERLLRGQMTDFKSCPPEYDPAPTGVAAPLPTLWKTFFTFFPRIKVQSKGPFPLFDDLHARLKSEFIRAGLMLGQFYAGCRVPAIYNLSWRALNSPYPAFAIRYMAKHDRLFISAGTPEREEYRKYFAGGESHE
jgi:hypothetical protein